MSHHQDTDWMQEFIEGPMPVFIESPFSGPEMERNIEYARRAMWDSLLNHHEAPIVTHLLYTQNPQSGIVDDSDQRSIGRELGMKAAMQLTTICTRTVVYEDYGITPGMQKGIQQAIRIGHDIVYRRIGINA